MIKDIVSVHVLRVRRIVCICGHTCVVGVWACVYMMKETHPLPCASGTQVTTRAFGAAVTRGPRGQYARMRECGSVWECVCVLLRKHSPYLAPVAHVYHTCVWQSLRTARPVRAHAGVWKCESVGVYVLHRKHRPYLAPVALTYTTRAFGSRCCNSSTARPVRVDSIPFSGTRFFARWASSKTSTP